MVTIADSKRFLPRPVCDRKRDGKDTPVWIVRLHSNAAAMSFDRCADHRQAESGAADLLRASSRAAVEAFEDLAALGRCHARTVIRDTNFNLVLVYDYGHTH